MKKYIGLLLMLFSLEATAQLHMKANLQTNHLWRGIEVADGLVITGDVNYSLCNGLFNLGFWGGTNTLNTKIKRKKRKQKQPIILIHRYL